MTEGTSTEFQTRLDRKHLLLFAIVLAILLFTFYWPYIISGASFYRADITFYYEPACRFIGNALREGRLPLWNPFCAAGMPQISQTSPDVFYPFNMLFACMDFSQALAWMLLIHQLIAGIGGYLLVASLGWGSLAAMAAGFVLSLNGYMFSLDSIYPLPVTASWIPLTLWLTRLVCTGRKPLLPGCWLAIAIGMLVLAGRPELYGPTVLLVAGWAIAHGVTLRRGGATTQISVRPILIVALAIVIGLLLAAPSLLPPCEWVRLSPRARGMEPQEVMRWSANWYDFLCLFVAQPLGDLHHFGNRFLQLVWATPSSYPLFSSAYVGPGIIALAICAMFDKRFVWRSFILALLCFSLCIAAGNNLPVLPALLSAFPVISLFRYPSKALIFAVLALALLAAAGIRAIVDGSIRPLALITVALTVVYVTVMGAVMLAFHSTTVWLPLPPLATSSTFEPLISAGQQEIAKGVLIGGLVILVVIATILLFRKYKAPTRLAGCLLLAEIVIPMLGCALSYSRHTTEQDFFDHPVYAADQIAALSNGKTSETRPRIAQLYEANLFLIVPPIYHAPNSVVSNSDIQQYARQMLQSNTNMDAGIPSILSYEGGQTDEYVDLPLIARMKSTPFNDRHGTDLPLARLCQMSAVGYVLSQSWVDEKHPVVTLDSNLFRLQRDNRQLNLRIYEVVQPLPRAYFTHRWQWEPSRPKVLQKIANAESSNFDAAQMTYLEPTASSQGESPIEHEAASRTTPAVVEAKIEEVVPEQQVVHVDAPTDGVVVVADQYYPGWQATVDGTPSELFRANGFQRAVFVKAGKHDIHFSYAPASLTLALQLCAGGLLSLTLLGALAWRMK
jgi:hypothetical protein